MRSLGYTDGRPGPSNLSSAWLGRRYLFRVGRLRIPSYAAMLYAGFAVGVAVGGHESGLDFPRFTTCAAVLLETL